MSLIFDSYSYKFGDYGKNNGNIFDILISGDPTTYNVNWSGNTDRYGTIGLVSGFTDLSASITHPDLENLVPGSYTGTVYSTIDPTISSTTVVEIIERSKLLLDAELSSDACLLDSNNTCTITINDFNHDVNNFVYNLYIGDSLAPYESYSGTKGGEIYNFSGLSADTKYRIEAYETDEVVYIYKNIVACVDGDVEIENGTDPVNIVNNWSKICPLSLKNMLFYNNSNTVFINTGLNSDGIITSDDPGSWFFTGNPLSSTVWFDNTINNYYLGISGKTDFINIGVMGSGDTMMEGMNVGPILTNEGVDISQSILSGGTSIGDVIFKTLAYRFYYNTDINKFLILYPGYSKPGTDKVYLRWYTFDPNSDMGSIGNPTSNDYSTSNEQWHTEPFSSYTSGYRQYTIDSGNTVVLASDKLTGDTSMIECSLNSAIPNGFISGCGYSNYMHEITIGSNDGPTLPDNDVIGIILAWFRDDVGIYGPIDASHNISLSISLSSGIVQNIGVGITITHNLGVNAYGFTGSTDQIIYKPSTSNRPFKFINYYYNQGYTRVKVTRSDKIEGSGNGELFKIEMTDTMGDKLGVNGSAQNNATKNIGDSNPYNSNYEINFDLSDSSTWGYNTSETESLKKFYGPQKYGYFTTSQPKTQFFDITFSGAQSNTRPTSQTLVPGVIDNVTIPVTPYVFNCETINSVCSDEFESTSGGTDGTLYIDGLDKNNNTSMVFDLISNVIEDPCPVIEPTVCGCPCNDCDNAIRIKIKKKII